MTRDEVIRIAEHIKDPKPLRPIHKESWTVYPEWLMEFAKTVIEKHERKELN
jgi:hypothetical protein